MSYRERRHVRRQKTQAIGIIILLSAVLIVGGLGFAYMSMRARHVELNPSTLCPVDGPTGHIAVIIDASDPFLPSQAQFIRKYFNELRESIPKYARVSIYVSSDYREGGIAPRLVICNPGDGSDASPLTANPRKLHRQWAEKFGEPISQAITESISVPPGQESPLLEILQAITLAAFPLNDDLRVERSMIIVSDMLEHSQFMSQYKSLLSFESLYQKGLIRHLKPNLEGVEVAILYISRPGYEANQTRRHVAFWEEYFRHYGAQLTLVERI